MTAAGADATKLVLSEVEGRKKMTSADFGSCAFGLDRKNSGEYFPSDRQVSGMFGDLFLYLPEEKKNVCEWIASRTG